MADPNTRQGKRTPVTLKIKFKSETIEQFIERYAVDVSQGGIFIRTKEPLAVGTQMKFEFQLRDASPLIAGEGTVVWTRENDPSRPAIAPGMGVRFDRLAEGSQGVLERILAEKSKQAPQRTGADSTKPPMFTDTPTRVAPAPVQEALLGPSPSASPTSQNTVRRSDNEPKPFHSDAEDFDEHAFEEATKVRSLEELAAQSAELGLSLDPKTATNVMPADELARRRQQGSRADSTLADPPVPDRGKTVPDRDSAPGLPSPPAVDAQARPGKLLDTTPSPRPERPTAPPTPPPTASADPSPKTRLGMEPARAPTAPRERAAEPDRVAVPTEIAADSSRQSAPKRPSSAPVVIGILVAVAVLLAGGWYLFLRSSVEEQSAKPKPTTAPVATGSAEPGSAAVATGSDTHGSAAAGSNAGISAPAAGSNMAPVKTVDTVIASTVPQATIEVVGTDQSGPAPLTAHLEADKPYKVRVQAPGFATQELDVKGGQDKVTAKLVAKPHVLAITSDPPGAQIVIENAVSPKLTPAEIELTPAQAAKPRIHVVVRKMGFRPVDQMVEATGFTDEDARLVGKVDAKLTVMKPVDTGGTPVKPNPGTGSGTGAALGTAFGTGSGSGSSAPPPSGSGSTPPSGAGSGSSGGATAPPSTGSAAAPKPSGSGSEPEPDWTNKP